MGYWKHKHVVIVLMLLFIYIYIYIFPVPQTELRQGRRHPGQASENHDIYTALYYDCICLQPQGTLQHGASSGARTPASLQGSATINYVYYILNVYADTGAAPGPEIQDVRDIIWRKY